MRRRLVDLGCGEGALQKELEQKKIFRQIQSFDLVKMEDHVIEADIKNLPLEPASQDVAVFCLSLMGTNYIEFLQEAARVLKIGGQLIISEVLSRFQDLSVFHRILYQLGFTLLYNVHSFLSIGKSRNSLQLDVVQEKN